ncbi:aminomethyl-transferring glycine dehydrogenase subunit GcvPA [Haematospirillum jordaniae]|uniref:Probable glycine dehydrogenase (decarboxylating) subunit 1 n=1 Tax=Haematospirillum jordaniae TaxID=1549855 RepID=A0A143DC56_9PROT|nr:aminomethyl-transferring glycine dehydrogenase subunit GcvPA [Haematospirillum jordaniae]AMW34236.1 glycine dehydrogenase [Haematospirillum jordaniae]NKD45082.1 aminomethyl-transferring glycine dehydrogenase subunit GcvPA [Haematospirillum jordaniae]NKD57099.1 aminomethyl-transferring glycine dehydrogenase subunit GcvPA [Haematospirillum jordaniae]NKD59332.1 aminomethyl-transferring glycine dehydrogenase subunit GcvPA [Haematospirillum jordaniae]NKD67025.1 aminomethyl-transferring glycine d
MRYLPLTEEDRRQMLDRIGAGSVEDLFRSIPQAARDNAPRHLPGSRCEMDVEREIQALAARNLDRTKGPTFLGAGNYFHHVPAALDYLIQRGEFMTAYTPYQPEIAQGTLQVLFEFQTQVAMITGMEVANASLYDGATACAEAAAMAARITGRSRVVISGQVHPHFSSTTHTFLKHTAIDVEILPPDPMNQDDLLKYVEADVACIIVQTPGFFGHLHDTTDLANALHAAGALLVVAVCETLSLGIVKPPGAMGADIVVGEGQSLAIPPGFGGPGVGLFATRNAFIRQMPGRLCGETVDSEGRRGFVLTLSTREQHIRREKATSNICTNSGLIATAFSIFMTLLGDKGFTELAELNHALACTAADRLAAIPGVSLLSGTFFNEFALMLKQPAAPVVDALAERNIMAGIPASRFWPGDKTVENILLVAVTETNTDAEIRTLVHHLGDILA